jgi:hypothetical protein
MGFSMHKTGRLHSTDGVAGRMRAQQLAPVDPAAALAVARVVADAWYRCQALSSVARVAPYEVATKAFREARAAAAQGADDYQRAAVLAFTIERRSSAAGPRSPTRSCAKRSTASGRSSRPTRARSRWRCSGSRVLPAATRCGGR